MARLRNVNPLIAVALVAALVVGLLVAFWPKAGERTVVAEFPRAVSLYEGSDVKILGVAVGKVDKVKPVGTKVVVTFHYSDDYKVPADAKAVVISPSIVGDRFVQLTPVYKSGPTLSDNAHLGVDRTAVPLELDQIFGSINDLNIALGPQGVNKPDSSGQGALSRLLDSTARNFGGQGVQFNKTLRNLGKFTQTLSDNKDQLFGTVAEVEKFTKTFAANDDTIRRFNDSLASGSQLLADERQDLAAVLVNLGVAMRDVRTFVSQNRQLLSSNIRGLARISDTLAKRRDALDEVLRDAPVALDNLLLAGNAKNGTLDTRSNFGPTMTELQNNPGNLLCTLLGDTCSGPLETLLGQLGTPAAGRAAPFGPTGSMHVIDNIDRSLGGLVEVQR